MIDPREIERLVELSEKATQGEWSFSEADESIGYRKPNGNWGLIFSQFRYGGKRLSSEADAPLVVALVNFFRAHHAELAQAQKDAESKKEPR